MSKIITTLSCCLLLTSYNGSSQTVLSNDSLSTATFTLHLLSDGTREFLNDTAGRGLFFSGELWLGGYDQMQQLHQSSQTYKQNKVNYFYGPVNDANDPAYNRLWHVHQSQIDSFKLGLYSSPPQVFSDWPAHGDTSNGEPFYLAPFVDSNKDGWYDPNYGDYPSIKGEEAIYFIYNDYGDGIQNPTAFKVDIHGMAFRMEGGGIQDSMLFLDYRIVNRSSNDYEDMYIGSWSDMDLGNSSDDLVGSHINLNAIIGYNGDSDDGTFGFGNELASLAHFIRKGPPAPLYNGLDDDRDGCIDGVRDAQGNCAGEDPSQGIREYLKMSHSNFSYNSGTSGVPGVNTDPSTAVEYYNLLAGKCKDGTNLTISAGKGIWDPANPFSPCAPGGSGNFIYPGNSYDSTGAVYPDKDTNWFMPPTMKGDIRTLISSGPFELKKGEAVSFKLAYLWHLADSANSALDGGYSGILKKLGAADSISRQLDTTSGGIDSVISLNPSPTKKILEIYFNQKSNHYVMNNLKESEQLLLLYNISGQLIKRIELRAKDKKQLDLSSYSRGIYFLFNTSENRTYKLVH